MLLCLLVFLLFVFVFVVDLVAVVARAIVHDDGVVDLDTP